MQSDEAKEGASMPRRFLVERASEHSPADGLGLDGDLLVIGRETSSAPDPSS